MSDRFVPRFQTGVNASMGKIAVTNRYGSARSRRDKWSGEADEVMADAVSDRQPLLLGPLWSDDDAAPRFTAGPGIPTVWATGRSEKLVLKVTREETRSKKAAGELTVGV